MKLLEPFHRSCISKMCDCAEYQQEQNTGRKKQTEKGITRHTTQEMSAVDTSTKLFTAILNQRGLVHMFSHKCHCSNASRREHLEGKLVGGVELARKTCHPEPHTNSHTLYIVSFLYEHPCWMFARGNECQLYKKTVSSWSLLLFCLRLGI